MTSARARTRDLLQQLISAARARRPPVLFEVGMLHALRDFAAACYERGYRDASDLQHHSTAPAPPNYPRDDD